MYLGWPSGYLTAGQTGGQTSTGLKDKGLHLKVVSDFFLDSLKESIYELLGCMDSMSNGHCPCNAHNGVVVVDVKINILACTVDRPICQRERKILMITLSMTSMSRNRF